jgi:hypothetical protein
MRTRSLLIVLVTASAVLGPATAAVADHAGPGGWVDIDEDGSQVDVGAGDGEETAGDEGSGGTSACTWSRVPDEEIDVLWWTVGSEVGSDVLDPDGDIADPLDFEWYWMSCPDGQDGLTTDLIPVPRENPVDPTDLRDEAIDTLSLPFPTVAMNPAGDQVVHVETWLWVDDAIWRTHSKSVSAGGVTTTVTAAPTRVIWDLGNGDTVVCDGPGTPYDPSIPSDEQTPDCSYTYTHTSAGQPGDEYQVTATIEWSVDWTVTGAPGGGPLPALFTSSPVAVRVAEMQALNQ